MKSLYSSDIILFVSLIVAKFICLLYKILTCSEFSHNSLLSLLTEIAHIYRFNSSISLLMWTNFSVKKLIIWCQKLVFKSMFWSHSNSNTTSCLSVSIISNCMSQTWGLIWSLISFISWSIILLLYNNNSSSTVVTL